MKSKKGEFPELKGWMTCSQVAEELGISRQSANRMVADHRLKSVHVLGERPIYVVKRSEVEKLKKEWLFGRLRAE